MPLCSYCSREKDRETGVPIRPIPLKLISSITKFSRLFYCEECHTFQMKKHPKARDEFYTSLPGGKTELPKGCLHMGHPIKEVNR